MTTSRARGVSRAAILAAAVLLAVPGLVSAHAELDIATPPAGAVVTGQPAEVSGTFTQDVAIDGSSLLLRDAAGEVIAKGAVDADDARRMAIVDLPVLAPGTYEVRWTTRSAEDDEIARDTWTFTVVAAPTATPGATPTPVVTSTVTPAASASATPTSRPGSPTPGDSALPTSATASAAPTGDAGGAPPATADAVVPIVVALGVVLIAALALIRRRGQGAERS